MKPISYVLCYTCLMHYLAFAATKMGGDWTIPMPLFLMLNCAAFAFVMVAIKIEQKP